MIGRNTVQAVQEAITLQYANGKSVARMTVGSGRFTPLVGFHIEVGSHRVTADKKGTNPMPCNLAVSITKAAVTDARLRALLTPEAVQPIIEAYLRQPGVVTAGERASVQRQGDGLVVQVGSLTLTIRDGRVETRAARGYNDTRAQELADALSALLALAADTLFAQQVKAALATFGKVAAQQVTVDNSGVTQAAMVLTLQI